MNGNEIALEILNGSGVIIMIILAVALTVVKIRREIMRGSDTVTQLALSMIIMKIGIGIALGYRWYLRRCINAGADCSMIEQDYWILIISTSLIVCAGLMILRILSPPHWRPWSWLSGLVASILVPFVFYFFRIIW